MPEYRKQHYNTKRFLSRFSDTKGNIFLFNDSGQRQVPYKQQCQKKYFYSKTDPKGAESYLELGEEELSKRLCNLKICTRNDLTVAQLFILVCDFNLRGISYVNSSNLERIDILNKGLTTFINRHINGLPLSGLGLPELYYNTATKWRCCHLAIEEGIDNYFITSDNPVVVIDIGENQPSIVYFPISPKEALVFANFEIFSITEKEFRPTEDLINELNAIMALNCVKNIYSLYELSKKNQKSFCRYMSQRKLVELGSFDIFCNKELTIKPAQLSADTETLEKFSFLRNQKGFIKIVSFSEAERLLNEGLVLFNEESKKIKVSTPISCLDLYNVQLLWLIKKRAKLHKVHPVHHAPSTSP